MISFENFQVSQEILTVLAGRGITEPTAVQKEVIPRLLNNESLVFQSETGTGKTLCYLLPAFSKILQDPTKTFLQVLIIAPTHELASQIKSEAGSLAKEAGLPIKTGLCIGGSPIKRQVELLKEHPQILVGGPARIIELIRLKKLKTQGISLLILDESDRMLAPEMRDMISEIFTLIPSQAQIVACSATMSTHHVSLLEKMAVNQTIAPDKKYKLSLVQLPPEDVLKRNISHWAFWSDGRNKINDLRKFILAEKPAKALVFTAIVGQVENIAAKLMYNGIKVVSLHAKLGKLERKQAIDAFRSGKVPILITSDLSARGLDIPNITHVIQLDVNENEDFFIHRAGRTARAGKSGINAIFGDAKELKALARIEKKLKIIIYPKVLYGGSVRTPDQKEDV